MLGVLKNKVILYVASRYIVYGLQFITLLILSEKLGPYYYGIWGFILMIISYMNIINLGIAGSINIYIIQHKNNLKKVKDYISSSFGASLILFIGLLIFTIIYYYNPHLFSKYNLGSIFYIIVLVGGFQYLNTIFTNIYRARNNLFEVAFCQSSVPVFIFLIVIFSPIDKMINNLVYGYLLANITSFGLFIFRGKYPRWGRIKVHYVMNLLRKGIFLFLYNSAFYLILTTTSSFVSKYYNVAHFGIFSFSYTLGHSILLLMEAFSFIIYPKVIDKLYAGDNNIVESTLKTVRVNYVTLSHCLMYLVIAVLPSLMKLFPKFDDSLMMMEFMILSIIISTNSFGYNTLLIARNKEKLSAIISCISLIVNIVMCIIIINILHLPYYLSIISVLISYCCFALLCSWFAHKILYEHTTGFVKAVFPNSLIFPYFIAIIIAFCEIDLLLWIPLILFIILNRKILIEIWMTLKKILKVPDIVNINNIRN